MSEFLIVDTEYGPVKGRRLTSVMHADYLSFRGIPYMKPPLGKRRFREAQTPKNWTDPFDATEEGPSYCMTDFMTGLQDGQENAGTINVYTKSVQPGKLMPVMIWVGNEKASNCDAIINSAIISFRFMAAATREVRAERTFTVRIIFSKKTSSWSRSTTGWVLSAFSAFKTRRSKSQAMSASKIKFWR